MRSNHRESFFNMMAGSVALNALLNVYCYNMALGDSEGQVEIPQFDYTKPLNFGSVEFTVDQREPLTQKRAHDPDRVEHVPLTRLDRFGFEKLDLLKVDVEGMEIQVLEGCKETISRCKPVIFAECLKSDRVKMRKQIADFGYSIYENRMNFLCVPPKYRDVIKINTKRGAALK